jgi:hypothetical protein
MGCGASRPPPYEERVRYANKRQLYGALRVLRRPPTDTALWQIAYSIVSVAIATAHRKQARRPEVAIAHAGAVAIFAAAATAELREGVITSIAVFVRG